MKAVFLVVIVFMWLGQQSASAQVHGHHHTEGELGLHSDSGGSTFSWDAVNFELQREFDSTYTSTLRRNPRELGQVYRTFLDRIPAKAILEFLSARQSYCHSLAHDLGQAVYRHYGALGVAVRECGDGCSSACMHGAVREAFGSTTVDEIVAGVDSVCAIEGMETINRPGNCAHALGHALMMSTGDSLSASLDGCSQFPGLSLPHYCATGVFMEYGADRTSTDRPPTKGEVVSHYPCSEFGEFAAACYRYVASRMRRVLQTGDPGVLAAECRKLSNKEELGCFRGLGVAFAGAVRREPESIHSVCSDAETDNVLVCIDALVEQIASFRQEEAETVCNQLEGEALDVCTAALTGRYELYKPVMDIYLASGD